MAATAVWKFRRSFIASKIRNTSIPLSAARLDEALDDIVSVVAVAKDVLCAKQHLHRRPLGIFFNGTQTFPGIFAEETDAGIESRAPQVSNDQNPT